MSSRSAPSTSAGSPTAAWPSRSRTASPKWGQQADFYPASWNTCVYQGKVYGLPYLSAPRVLLYRKDLLAKAGFTRPPDTWEELADGRRRR